MLNGFVLKGLRKSGLLRWDALLKQLLFFGVPLTLLAIWLQYSHVMRVDNAGEDTGLYA